MWIVTTIGFFSVVEKPWDKEAGTLTVRARAREDLESLRSGYLPGLGAVEEDPEADYRYRAQAPRSQVSEAIARIASDIDYDNFTEIRQRAREVTQERSGDKTRPSPRALLEKMGL